MFKKVLYLVFLSLLVPGTVFALSTFLPVQGGTGIGSATSTDVGKVLTVSSTNPFTYKFTSGGSGASTSTPFAPCSYWASSTPAGLYVSGCFETATPASIQNLAVNSTFATFSGPNTPTGYGTSTFNTNGDPDGSATLTQSTSPSACNGDASCLKEAFVSSATAGYVATIYQGFAYNPATAYAFSVAVQRDHYVANAQTFGFMGNYPLNEANFTSLQGGGLPDWHCWNWASGVYELASDGFGGDCFLNDPDTSTAWHNLNNNSLTSPTGAASSTMYFSLAILNSSSGSSGFATETAYVDNFIFGVSTAATGTNQFVLTAPSTTHPIVLRGANVGINTSTPSTTLFVNGTFGVAQTSTLQDTTINGTFNCLGLGCPGATIWALNGTTTYYTGGDVAVGTSTSIAQLTVTGDGSMIGLGSSTYDPFTDTSILGGRTFDFDTNLDALLWYPRKAAFVAGYVDSLKDNDIGFGSVNLGLRGTASATGSVAIGLGSVASGKGSVAFGCTASGDLAFCAGQSLATGPVCTALNSSDCTGTFALSSGLYNLASADYSFVGGNHSTSSGQLAFAFGSEVGAAGRSSYALGSKLTVSGNNSFGLNLADTPVPDVSDSQDFVVQNVQHIGFNTSTPEDTFDLVAPDGTNASMFLYNYAAGSFGNFLTGNKARGTQASPTAVQTGDFLMSISGKGYDGSKFGANSDAKMQIWAAQNFTSTAHGTYITFDTTANNTTTRLERMRIDQNGNVGIGTTTPSTTLAVVGMAFVSGTTTINGELQQNFGVPTLSSCGTNPSVAGSNHAGTVTVGSGVSVTACTINFVPAFVNAPHCTLTGIGTFTGLDLASQSNSAIVVNTSVSLAGGQFNYVCIAD